MEYKKVLEKMNKIELNAWWLTRAMFDEMDFELVEAMLCCLENIVFCRKPREE